MPAWTLVGAHPKNGRAFCRPLDVSERCSLWDGLFNGTADTLQHFEIRLVDSARDAHLFSDDNIVKAWLSIKRRFPLAGATVIGANMSPQIHPKEMLEFASEPCFVVRERDLGILFPKEIVFMQVTCAKEIQQRLDAILHGPRPLSNEMLAQLYVFRETRPGRTGILHLATLVAHCITDGIANFTLMRCLLDTLARSGTEPAQIPLEERLMMAIPSMEREPKRLRSVSPAMRRWRRVVGTLIYRSRIRKWQGGHTLPCRLVRSAPDLPGRSSCISTTLTHAHTTSVMTNCRLYRITFGNAYLALAQVAMTRVLYRRYLGGEISSQEWAYRRRQPQVVWVPFNLRPYLDEEWFGRGGGGEFMLSVGGFQCELPVMPLSRSVERHRYWKRGIECTLSNGAPPFSELLTFNQFLTRVRLLKKQAAVFFNHPLFHEILLAGRLARVEPARQSALQWMERFKIDQGSDIQSNLDSEGVLKVMDMPQVPAFGGTSLGNVDLIFPFEYPLPCTHPLSPYASVLHPLKAGYVTPASPLLIASEVDMTPKIVVENHKVHLHVRPSELYLGAESTRGQLHIYAHYDSNVFEDAVVNEWLDEVKEALLWYLGQTHNIQPGDDGPSWDGLGRTAGGGERLKANL